MCGTFCTTEVKGTALIKMQHMSARKSLTDARSLLHARTASKKEKHFKYGIIRKKDRFQRQQNHETFVAHALLNRAKARNPGQES